MNLKPNHYELFYSKFQLKIDFNRSHLVVKLTFTKNDFLI